MSSPSSSLSSFCPSPFLPFSHPHVYGFSLPLIFSFLPSSHFPILSQITKHQIWTNAVHDPLTSAHYSFIVEERYHDDFPFLSPHFISLIQHIEIKERGVGPYAENANIFGRNSRTCKYLMILKGIMEHLKSIAILPVPLHLRSLSLNISFAYHCDSAITFIQFIIEEIINYQRDIQNHILIPILIPRQKCISDDAADVHHFCPLLLRLDCQCNCVDVRSSTADNRILLTNMKKWVDQCLLCGITLQFNIHHEGIHPVWEHVIMEKYEYQQKQMLHHNDDDLSSSLSLSSPSRHSCLLSSPFSLSFPSPLSPSPFPFIHLKTIKNLIGTRSPIDPSQVIPFSTILPLACPLLSTLFISPTDKWSPMEYKEAGQCIHSIRHSLRSLLICCILTHDHRLDESKLVQFILFLPIMFPYLKDLSYPNITTMNIFLVDYPLSVKKFYQQVYDSYRPFVMKFPNVSSLSVSPYDMMWILPMENYKDKEQNQIQNGELIRKNNESSLFPHVTSLSVSLEYLSQFDDPYINPHLLQQIPLLIQRVLSPTLQYLDLGNVNHQPNPKVPPGCTCEILYDALSSCHSLKSLRMTMSQTCCHCKDFLSLFSSLSHCHQLTTMALYFDDSLWSEEGMISMKQNIHNKNHPYLTSLMLSKMSDIKCVEYIGDILFGLPSLRSVNINLIEGNEKEKENETSKGYTEGIRDDIIEKENEKGKEKENATESMEHISAHVIHSLSNMSQLRYFTLVCSSDTFLSHWTDPFFSSLCHHNVHIQSIQFFLTSNTSNISFLSNHVSALLDGINSFYSHDKYHSESLVRLREFHISFENLGYAFECQSLANGIKEGSITVCPHEEMINLALNKISQSDLERKRRGQKLSSVCVNFTDAFRNLTEHLRNHKRKRFVK